MKIANNLSGYNGSGDRSGGRIESKQSPKDRGSGRKKC